MRFMRIGTSTLLRRAAAASALLLWAALLFSGTRDKAETGVVQSPTLAPNIRSAKQGFLMRMMTDNKGVFGLQAYPGGDPAAPESLGLEYPVGEKVEHLFGTGIWVGGLLDTNQNPNINGPQVRGVSTAYEGWSGPLYEFYPGASEADSIWIVRGRNAQKPAGWDAYWGNALPFQPISDMDMHTQYQDFDNQRVSGHVPLRLRVLQSSYAWNESYAEAIIIVTYRIVNAGIKPIDSAYIGFFFEADVGPIYATNYFQRNFTGYYSSSKLAYIHNPIDRGSTPVGVTILEPQPSPGIRYSFNWFPGPQTPVPDFAKYDMMASGQVDPDEYPAVSDTRFVFSFGPFRIAPSDTLKIAAAIVSGYSQTRDPRIIMQRNAARALDIYLNQGIRLPAIPPSPPLRANVGFRRVELDWKWKPGDDLTFGRTNPEANWDTTNLVARRDPARFRSPHPPGHPVDIDTNKGGRNFEAYRLWRSENPDYPDASFTLVKQYDVIESIDTARYQYDTGLEYTYVDSNLVRGKTYVYSVTSVSIPNLAEVRQPDGTVTYEEVEPLESGFRVNAVRVDLPFAAATELGKVMVVPNPYRTDKNYTLESGGYEGLSAGWDETRRLVKFINLPAVCTIRIFSLSGDLVRTVEHDGGTGTFPDGDEDVPLVSESNRALASGIYIFTVESPGLETQTGKFVIIR
jgi:hypothetical protein